MTVDTLGQERFRIVDINGIRHYACCPICALKLMKTYGELNITSFCDLNGPSYPITIAAKQHGSLMTISPTGALIVVGNDCTENRMVYDSSAADALLAPPNNGASKWLSQLTNTTIAPNATRMGIVQATIQYVGVTPIVLSNPEPTSTSNSSSENTSEPAVEPTTEPTSSPSEEGTHECEACGMTVTEDDLWHFNVTDETGKQHYVECYMCALNLIKRYETLHIQAFCDWYGQDYPITVSSSGYGAQTTVNPQSAMYLYAGTCENNRVAYNETAADALGVGYSQNTSLLQQHEWISTPTIITVSEAIALYNPNSKKQDTQQNYNNLILVAFGSLGASAAVIVAVAKFRKK